MRKVTTDIIRAFYSHTPCRINNSTTDEDSLYLHGNKIAQFRDGTLWITNAGWQSNTTKERLNGLNGVSISQKDFVWFLNGKEWNGEWIEIS